MSGKSSGFLTDEEKLAAWCEWRKWCSINRVLAPNPTREEIARGVCDELDASLRNQYFRYLSGSIASRLTSLCNEGFYIPEWLSRGAGGDELEEDDNSDLDETIDDEEGYEDDDQPCVADNGLKKWIHEFDIYMSGGKKRFSAEDAAHFAAGASYKDYLFYLVEKSEDPPLKVIVGKTVGPQGYLLDIIKRDHFANQVQGSNDTIEIRSLDDDLKGSDEDVRSLYDCVAAEESSSFNPDIDELIKSLDVIEMVMLLAECYGISLEAESVHIATGLRKSSLSVRRNSLYERLKEEWGSELFGMARQAIYGMIERLETEKSTVLFLKEIEEKEREQALKRRTNDVEE